MINKPTSKSGNKLIYLLGFIVALAILGYVIKQNGNNRFEQNKEQTSALVRNFIKDSHNGDYVSYKRYLLEYDYKIGNRNYKNNFEIRIDDLNDYFHNKPKPGDTISITYNSLSPKESKPVKK